MLDFLGNLDEMIETEVVDGFEEAFREVRIDDLTILHLNIRSVRKNFEEFLVYLESVNDRVGVVVLSETWNVEEVSRFKIPLFNIFYNESRFNKNDGLIVYIRDVFTAQVINYSLTETVLCRVLLRIEKLSIGITASYRPPSTDALLYIRDVHEYMKTLKRNPLEIFLGDINFNLLDNSSLDVTNYHNMLSENGYISYINEITRETETSKSILDHIFIRRARYINDCVTIKPLVVRAALTDHFATLASLRFKFKIINRSPGNLMQIDRTDFDKLSQYLNEEGWKDVLKSKDVQSSYNIFIDKVQGLLQRCSVRKTVHRKFVKLKPWITRGLIESINKRDRLKKNLTKNFSIELKNEYCQYRNELNKLIRITKNDYYMLQIKNAGNNYKKIWKTINCATNNKSDKSSSSKISLRDENGVSITDDRENAAIFNNFFARVGTNIAEKIKTVKPDACKRIKTNKIIRESVFLSPVTENEIIEEISSLKNDAATGPDKLQAKLLKRIHMFITKPLCHIINLTFTSGSLPLQWKESIIVPVFKSGNHDNPSNYRPISLINNFAKIFEKCFKRRLLSFYDQHHVISGKQFGFKKGVSTMDAALDLVGRIVTSLDESKKCMTVFLDLAKAFDTISHERLLTKLSNTGVRGIAYDLLKDYLRDRSQCVRVGNSLSDSTTVVSGVPQGTVLGPLLFLIYFNDVFEMNNISDKIISYADDTAIVFVGDSWDALYRTAESCLFDLYEWLSFNSMSLNFCKTKFITFSITIDGQPDNDLLVVHNDECTLQSCACPSISRVDEIKYLGIMVDKYLRWEAQSAMLMKRLRLLQHKFYVLRDIFNTKTLLLLYNSLVESVLRYCVIVWGGLTKNAGKGLQISQNSLIKIMFRKDLLHPTDELYYESGIMNVRTLFIYQTLMYMFSQDHPLIEQERRYVTRAVDNESLEIRLFRKSCSQRFIFYIGPKYYNRIPLNVRKIKNRKTFSRELRKLLFENRFTFDL